MWRAVCCEVQGIGHKKANVPCQDKTFKLMKNGVYVIALADGAGTSNLSHYGAERIVHDMSEYLVNHFVDLISCNDGRKVKKNLVDLFRVILLNEAEIHKCNIHDLASTLLLAAVHENHFILLHIGDGVIGYLDEGNLKVASKPDNGEFSNVTTFVTSSEVLSSMRLFKGELKNVDAFVLMSDGTEYSLYHKPSNKLADVIKRLMHRTCLIDNNVLTAQLTDSFNAVISKNTQDDCSIAILARTSKVLCPIEALSLNERMKLYGIERFVHCAKRRAFRYDTILKLTKESRSPKQIARSIHLKPKYAKKQVEKLVLLGLLIKKQGNYQNIQYLNK